MQPLLSGSDPSCSHAKSKCSFSPDFRATSSNLGEASARASQSKPKHRLIALPVGESDRMTAFFVMMMHTGESEPLKRRWPRRFDLRGHRILVAGAGFTRAILALALRARRFASANFACKKAFLTFLLNPLPLGYPKVADPAPPLKRNNKSRKPPDFRQEAFCFFILVAGAGFEPTTFGL
jgi:hypothetical protein